MKNNTIITLTVFGILVFPSLVLAQPVFQTLVGIPGLENPHTNFNDYINTVYGMSIAIAALLAVIKIIVAGVKWMLSDIVPSKQEAKSEIQGALLGLLIIASAFLILNEINPNLTKTKLITSKVDRPISSGSTPTTSTPPIGSTTRPPVDMTGVPPEADRWLAIGNTGSSVNLPLNPSRPATNSSCAPSDSTCQDQFQTTCTANRGLFTTSGGVVQCVYYAERRLNCTDRIVQDRTERNCYDALARCQDRTPQMQRDTWSAGNVTCRVGY